MEGVLYLHRMLNLKYMLGVQEIGIIKKEGKGHTSEH